VGARSPQKVSVGNDASLGLRCDDRGDIAVSGP
jgi:hypothetical protein